MQKPLVSVVMITYGHEDYIIEAIKGVLMQEFDGHIELIIANDNSPDKTDLICKEFFLTAQLPPHVHIRYTKHDRNLGVIPNFIWALNQTVGRYVAICEGDDYWTDPLKLKKQADFLETNLDYGLVYTDVDILTQETGLIEPSFFTTRFKPWTTYEKLINFGYIAPCTWLMRREILADILLKDSLDSLDGTFVLMLYFSIMSKIHFINERTTIYRRLNESASHSKNVRKVYLRDLSLWKTQRKFINEVCYLPIQKQIDTHFVSNNLVHMISFKDWDTFKLIRGVDMNLSKKFKVLISLFSNKLMFNAGGYLLKKLILEPNRATPHF